MHGAQERKFAARAGTSMVRKHGKQTAYHATFTSAYMCMCRAGEGRRFRKDKAVLSSYSKMQIMPYYVMFKRHVHDITSCMGAWSNLVLIS